MQHIVHVYENIYFITNKAGELNTDNTTVVNADDSQELSSMFVLTASGCKNVGEKQQCNSLGSLLLIRADGVARQDNETKTSLEVSVSYVSLNGATASYDYASTQKSVTFTKDSVTQTIEVPIYDDPYKESDETFWLSPVGGYGESKVAKSLHATNVKNCMKKVVA